MSNPMELQIKRLKEEEAREIAELKKNRLLTEEMIKKENERKAEEHEILNLEKSRSRLLTEVTVNRKKLFAIQTESDAWKQVAKKYSEELEKAEIALESKQEQIWKERESYCEAVDEYLDRYGILSSWWNEQMMLYDNPQLIKQAAVEREKWTRDKEKNAKEMKELIKETTKLESEVEMAEKEKDELSLQLRQLLATKDMLSQEPFGVEFSSIKAAIEASKARYEELSREVAEKEEKLQEFEEKKELHSVLFQNTNSNLFSMLDVNEIRKRAHLSRKAGSACRSQNNSGWNQNMFVNACDNTTKHRRQKEIFEESCSSISGETCNSGPSDNSQVVLENQQVFKFRMPEKLHDWGSDARGQLSILTPQQRKRQLDSTLEEFLTSFNLEDK